MRLPLHLFRASLLAFVLLLALPPRPLAAQQSVQDRVATLERKVDDLGRRVASAGAVLFLFGAFCALWAQNTNRNPWLWFFFGGFFSVVAVIVLLVKNADDRRRNGRPQFDLEDFRKQ